MGTARGETRINPTDLAPRAGATDHRTRIDPAAMLIGRPTVIDPAGTGIVPHRIARPTTIGRVATGIVPHRIARPTTIGRAATATGPVATVIDRPTAIVPPRIDPPTVTVPAGMIRIARHIGTGRSVISRPAQVLPIGGPSRTAGRRSGRPGRLRSVAI
jgi:hypothetical protein